MAKLAGDIGGGPQPGEQGCGGTERHLSEFSQ